MLHFLDKFLFVAHAGLILFNMSGWAFRRTRVIHLVTLGLTMFSWFVLGAFFGWGYCVCTDLHFQVRRRMGIFDADSSYIQLLFRELIGVTPSRPVADALSALTLLAILVATAYAWIRERRRRSPPVSPPPTASGR